MWKRGKAAVALLLLAPAVAAAPQVETRLTHYPVDGAGSREIRAHMTASNPLRKQGLNYDAYILWSVNWRFTTESDGRSCRVGRVSTEVDIHYTFPKLIPNPRRTAEVSARWRRFTKALAIHELGHKEFATSAAKEVERALPALPAQSDCEKLGELANAVGRRIVEHYTELDKEYDRKTDHGRTQGAHFP